ncbi:AarF/ABC1/UbiB kinase family protein [Lysinibacillus sp. BW-2-10]|uniref:ABC1 kinase family protein n=1 Tax=Lysinibacillus sp. BW-2-10 TaxID=2590030 RepID=UPI00117F6458|nr:AarF/UbiB family protein [Lysinibacillus sp. BW-2-10]TSI07707.1 AarF/ABC1/UbiB kinase family protein [Lysinibacillus sp. BW-2-10]
MNAIQFIIQILIVSVLIFFISGRLIGSNVNILKRILSVCISVSFTTFIFWYTYIRGTNFSFYTVDSVVNVATLLWVGSMLLISMLIYLFFELFDPIALDENNGRGAGKKSLIKRLIGYWRHQKRLRNVLKIAVTNGITRTMKYARNRDSDRELAIALRDTLEQCGGIFIKFGQVLSTRKELFSPVFIEELEKLQQNVTQLNEGQVQMILQQNLPGEIDEVFSYFSKKPLAAASIGQVHKAILRSTNEQVVVKILRPQVKEIMREDLSILIEFANWVSNRSQWAENLGFRGLAEGFAASLREEIDFNIEARNMIQIHNVLKNSQLKVTIPKVYDQYSNENVLVMGLAKGHSISTQHLFDNGDSKKIAETLLFTYLEQALVSGIFHADPHPGNIYYDGKTDTITLLDFGAVCRLSSSQQEGLKLFFIGIQQRDASILFDGISLLVKNKNDVDRHDLEQAISQIILKISYVDRIQTDELVYSIFTVIRDFGLQFYPSVNVALRVVVTLDGTLRIIERTFNIFEEAKVFSNNYLKQAFKKPFKEPFATKDRLEEELALILPNLRKIPRRVDQLFKRVEDGKVILHHDIFSDKNNAKFITQLFSKFVLLLVGITFGIISVALLAISQLINTAYAIYLNTAAYLGLFLCAILLVRLSIQAIRDMKRIE